MRCSSLLRHVGGHVKEKVLFKEKTCQWAGEKNTRKKKRKEKNKKGNKVRGKDCDAGLLLL